MTAFIQAELRAATTIAGGSRAEKLVAAIRAMPNADIEARIREAKDMTSQEIVARQRDERRTRAESAAARLRAL